MPTFGFLANLSPAVAGGIRVGIILVGAFVMVFLARRIIPKLITAHIPKIRRERPEQLAERSKTISRLVVQVISILVVLMAFIMILSGLGVDITPLIASLGVASLALGFAAQNIIRDYLHGLFIIMEDWYRVGEVAMISGTGGLVENITLRRTILRDLNGTMHIFPNSKVESASNLTRDWARINLNISVAYKENLGRVFEVVNQVCQEFKDDAVWCKDMLTVPHVERVDNLGDSGIEIKILGDT
jgi:small-conductance mechanosensitive channel